LAAARGLEVLERGSRLTAARTRSHRPKGAESRVRGPCSCTPRGDSLARPSRSS
jgi:hypothetical protein